MPIGGFGSSSMAQEDNCDIEEDTGHISTGVEIVLPMSHNTLTDRGVCIMRNMHFKSGIAQRELSDLGRRSLAL